VRLRHEVGEPVGDRVDDDEVHLAALVSGAPANNPQNKCVRPALGGVRGSHATKGATHEHR
jgi:hypothetical protein